MLVHATRITNLTDARYFAAKEVTSMGFNLEAGTPGYLDPIYMKAIREWVEGPKIVGEFDQTPAATVLEAARFYGLDSVQVTQRQGLQLLDGLEVLLSVPGTADLPGLAREFGEAARWVSCFILDFSALPAAQTLLATAAEDWAGLFAAYPTLLHLDVPAAELPGLLAALRPAGLVLRGGEEEQVGVKSFEEIDAVFEVLGF